MKIALSILLCLTAITCYSQTPKPIRARITIANAAAITPPIIKFPPGVNAGMDQIVTLPVSGVNLVGTGFDPDGVISFKNWAQIAGVTATLVTPTAFSTTVTGLSAGINKFQLTVTDNDGFINKDTVTVYVNPASNVAPTSNAGSNQTATLPASTVSLTGSGADSDGTISSYLWARVWGPSSGNITNPSSATTTVTGLTAGTYIYQLQVVDNSGAAAISTVQVLVNPDPNTNGSFQFSLASPASTSAGVYFQDSILIRTLWSNALYSAGTHTAYWDGKNDYGAPLTSPAATYKIRVVSNNVIYTWDGTIGNTSDSTTGNTKHNGYYNCMTGLAFASNGYGYFCNGYSEGKSSYSKLLTSAPQGKINLYANFYGRVITLTTNYVATDNVNVYWGGFDSYSPSYLSGQNNSMVHAMRCSDDGEVIFSGGSSYKVAIGAVTFNSVICKITATNTLSNITGLAVQQSGNYLFVARSGIDQLQVLNKTTGVLVQTLTYDSVRSICTDPSGNIWMITGSGTVARYTVNSNGTLTAATLTLSGSVDPLALQVNPSGTLISVADGGASDQVKFYSTTTGVLSTTLGTAGGYFTNPTVSDSKFYFHDSNTTTNADKRPFIAFQPNGSYWVNDPGNSRVQHYSSVNTFIDRIMSMGSTYNVYADPNNPARVWAGPLEFAIDYSQSLSGSSGWTLVKNWGAIIGNSYVKPNFDHPTTFPNGKTYAIIAKPGPRNNREVVEFTSIGPLRFTNTYRSTAQIFASDGSIQTINKATIGGVATVYRYPLTGYDGSGNPLWSTTPQVLATTPTITIDDPNDHITNEVVSSTGKVWFWCPDLGPNSSQKYTGYHLASIAKGSNFWLAKTELATHTNYVGPYPGAGFFDIGNQVYLPGGTLSIFGRNLITSYHGEFWKNAQTNKYNHYLDNGLSIGQFGTTRDQSPGNAPAMYAGNALTPNVVADPNNANAMFLYHGDEAAHSGFHRWHITGLNTIAEQSVTIPYPTAFVPDNSYVSLFAGLPFDSPLNNNDAGWTRIPATDILTNQYSNWWKVSTSRFSISPAHDNDIMAEAIMPNTGTYSISKDMGTNSVTNSWQISMDLTFPTGHNPNNARSQCFFEVLDGSGKVVFSVYDTATGIFCNKVMITSNRAAFLAPQSVKITVTPSSVAFQWLNNTPVTMPKNDITASWGTPKNLRVRFLNTGNTSVNVKGQKINFRNIKFYKD